MLLSLLHSIVSSTMLMSEMMMKTVKNNLIIVHGIHIHCLPVTL